MHSSAMSGTAIRTISRSIASGSGGASSSCPARPTKSERRRAARSLTSASS